MAIKATKAKPMLFKLRKDCAAFLRKEAKNQNKTMVSILEDLIIERKKFKTAA